MGYHFVGVDHALAMVPKLSDLLFTKVEPDLPVGLVVSDVLGDDAGDGGCDCFGLYWGKLGGGRGGIWELNRKEMKVVLFDIGIRRSRLGSEDDGLHRPDNEISSLLDAI